MVARMTDEELLQTLEAASYMCSPPGLLRSGLPTFLD